MSADRTARKAGHADLAAELRRDRPQLDDVRRVRLERRILAHVRDAGPAPERAGSVPSHLPWRSRPWVASVAALVAAALAGFLVRDALVSRPSPEARFTVDGTRAATREGPLTPGSRLVLGRDERGRLEIGDVAAWLRDEGAIEVRSADPDDVRFVLERGTVELAFHPQRRGRQRLRVETPNAEVEVVGTVFVVRVDAEGTTVSVREGTVRVTPRGGAARLLRAGESTTVPVGRATDREPSTNSPSSANEAVRDGASAAETNRTSADRSRLDQPFVRTAMSRSSWRHVASERSAADRPREADGRPDDAAGGVPVETAGVEVPPEPTSTPTLRAASSSSSSSPVAADRDESSRGAPALDAWAAHRPSSREIAAAWHEIDELQARGQFERSIALLLRLERYAPPSDQDEALFDRARTVQEALRRPAEARALYAEYLRRFPEGPHVPEVRRRLVALGGDPEPTGAGSTPK